MKAWYTEDYDNDSDEWEQEIGLTEQAVEAKNKLNPKPKIFVHYGDLSHTMAGTPWQKEQTTDLQHFFYNASMCPSLKQAQDHSLDQQLSITKQRRCQHAIVFQHIPLFLWSIHEQDDYFYLTKAL
ncbi:hypothetical protein A6R68_07371 [Neotoma lepida]|uniref:Calcineurin-like phosphoesterase domain-containing protein n=1 Tax=Neotoma lepida TaxID=56216 RepID=A0A1A6GCZ3_NEOLE|nr:hypothetical protein A6R68_07371 [Neotoma lepida]